MSKVIEFLQGQANNAWLEYPDMDVYVRRAYHVVNNEMLYCFDIANINVHVGCQGKGIFTQWLDEVVSILAHPDYQKFKVIRIENVLNPTFAVYLIANGWVTDGAERNFDSGVFSFVMYINEVKNES